jgi:hypothetical protein
MSTTTQNMCERKTIERFISLSSQPIGTRYLLPSKLSFEFGGSDTLVFELFYKAVVLSIGTIEFYGSDNNDRIRCKEFYSVKNLQNN